MILALDLGTKTGWAIGGPGKWYGGGSQNFAPRRFDGGGMRYLRFRHWLGELMEMQPFERVVFEEVRRHLGVDAAHAYGGFMATLTAWCEERSIPYEGIPVATIKVHATGAGNASKEMMEHAVREWMNGAAALDDNHADAIALLSLATGEPAWPPQPKPPKKVKK